ncbi:hypothetical protein B0T17DRAFT_623417 [Bombardia bombarda]|uniref:DDHD domain-containing protein n=1 Tax=Bombardia bombarda TaxID=252184 RepID=A0AA40CF42_9PEZI|nr:hypothetical protein B0T17DRAFT_623417 [Bombardia bombarda]
MSSSNHDPPATATAAPQQHTFGPSCRLAPITNPPPSPGLEDIPPIVAQFFYSSPIPIDDPLSAATSIASSSSSSSSSSSESKSAPLRPFSPGDNNALEKAWLGFASDRDGRNHRLAVQGQAQGQGQGQRRGNRDRSPSLSRENRERLTAIVEQLVGKHAKKHEREGAPPAAGTAAVLSSCCPELLIDVSAELRRGFCAVTRRRQQQLLNHDRVVEEVMARLGKIWAGNTGGGGADVAVAVAQRPSSSSTSAGGVAIPFANNTAGAGEIKPPGSSNGQLLGTSVSSTITARPPVLDDGISGQPFVRVETTPAKSTAAAILEDKPVQPPERDRSSNSRGGEGGQAAASASAPAASSGQAVAEDASPAADSVEIPVGISRLHMVSLPVLQMKPIYWSPVNDISIAIRATWFYRYNDTCGTPCGKPAGGWLPRASSVVGNMVRRAAVGPRCWSSGEEKVAHRLWPDITAADKQRSKNKDGIPPEPLISSDPYCAARCFRGEAAAEGTLDPVRPEQDVSASSSSLGEVPVPEQHSKSYASCHVIYKDGSVAFLLKPSLKPSAYYGRRPVSKIMKGLTVGIPVVRGFDRATWDRVHEKKKVAAGAAAAAAAKPPRVQTQAHPQQQPQSSRRRGAAAEEQAQAQAQTQVEAGCPKCQLDKDKGQVTDLILIVHGIGQKIAERVEAYHFTHAVTAFRRMVNVELENPAVKAVLRPNQNGIMVLPVNWRHLLSFEDGPTPTSSTEGSVDKSAYAPEGFGLKDIEPGTIPAVRGMISDVMFDIPFYMSHHKPQMIAAMVGEANRVYRLWCRNNPGFAEHGRVHLVGHSLGSAMAIEVLSKQQPSRVPRPLDLSAAASTSLKFLEFDVGRAGAAQGRIKPGADPADTVAKDVVGDMGLFGCIAVDNIYNILAKEDPIAYLLNGTVDPVYAASLKTAYVPSVAAGFLRSVGDAVRGLAGLGPVVPPVPVAGAGTGADDATKLPPTITRLPSQLELEVHDFTREDIAEKKAFLLNDNGQIDYYLRSGGGPLEIQYLNMLSAHTSYWANQDLIRLLCVEVGRRPGRENTLMAMRAVKKTKRLVVPGQGQGESSAMVAMR